MRDRIRPSKNHDDLLNQLRDSGLFETRQKAMMFAASLGYILRGTEPVSPLEGFGEGIPLSVFQRALDEPFVDAMAVTKAGTLDVLRKEEADHRFEAFEHFAAIGLNEIQKACYGKGLDPLDGLLELIDDHVDSATNVDKLPGLAGTLKELSRLI